MNAQEMFEQLGYQKRLRSNEIVYLFFEDSLPLITIIFDKVMLTYSINKRNKTVSVGFELHKAITQQMKELVWIE